MGHNLAIRIPKPVARELARSEGRQVKLSIESDRLVIEPTDKAPRYTLQELVAGITNENRHEEIDWGPPIGRE